MPARSSQSIASSSTRTLDIEQDPASQGYAEGTFDIVIGANVLHATVDLARTMTNVRRLLAPGGLLVLLETTKKQRFGDLTVGYTDGWWRFADTNRRASYALLDKDGWISLLNETGFEAPVAIGGVDDGRAIIANQALVMARATAAPADGSVLVVCGQRDQLTANLIESARQRRNEVCLVQRGTSYLIDAEGAYTLDPNEPEHFARLFSDLKRRFAGRSLRVVDLWPAGETFESSMDVDAVSAKVAAVSKPALYLTKACAAESGLVSQFTFVTRGTHSVNEGPLAVDLAQAPLWGFARVVELEHHELHCTVIDVPSDGSSLSSTALYDAVMRMDSGDRQLAVRRDGRFVRRMTTATVSDRPARPLKLRGDGAYLITGGLSGLGLLVAERMTALGAGTLVLVGRREPGADAQNVISVLRGRGVNVLTVAADVSRADDIARVFEAVASATVPLRGVIHSAGATDDAGILQQDWTRFERVMAAKVRGAWLLHQAVSAMPLDFFVLFSTGASFLGSPGQSNHAAANMFMDALAHHRQALGLPALSINWGAWSELGAATRGGVVERVGARGLRPITPEHGLAVLEFLIGTETAQAAVLPIQWPEFIEAMDTGRPHPLLSAVAPAVSRQAQAAAPVAAPAAAALDVLRAMPPQRARAMLLNWINEDAARVLGLDSKEPIDPARPLNALGLDSLMAVDLRNALGTRVGRTLPATLLFNYPTVGDLIDFLSAEVFGDAVGAAESSVPITPAPVVETAADELEDMSEDELATLLAGKLTSS